jgi:hypothetical protein
LNREPITEEGGLNLYGFVGNDSLYQYDVLGKFVKAPSLPIRPPALPPAMVAMRCGAVGVALGGGYLVGGKIDEQFGVSDGVSDVIIGCVETIKKACRKKCPECKPFPKGTSPDISLN